MTKNELRTLYEQQLLVEAVVEHSMLDEGWILEFRHTRGGMLTLTDFDGTERHFASVDDASDHALDVGFSLVRVVE